MSRGRVLFIDAYDSFSNNIASLLGHLSVVVHVIKIDDSRFIYADDTFFNFLATFDAVVAGPGPGHPANPEDVGLIGKLWTLSDQHLVPVIGICLGFQSLALAHGASIARLNQPRHGLVTRVIHCGSDIFAGTGEIYATQYHSLQACIQHSPNANELWKPSVSSQELLPLAWDLNDVVNGPILMAVRHRQKPFWGVQYHPESICTNVEGRKLATAWWMDVCSWNLQRRVPIVSLFPNGDANKQLENSTSSHDTFKRKVMWRSVNVPHQLDTAEIVSLLRTDCDGLDPLVLESGTRDGVPLNPETGRFSIIALQDLVSTHIRYAIQTGQLTVTSGGQCLASRSATTSEAFELLNNTIATNKASAGAKIPFWGGLVGFISYEAGLQTIVVDPSASNHPDIWFVLVERSIVIDHVQGKLYAQSLIEDDHAWLSDIAARLYRLAPSDGPKITSSFTQRPCHEVRQEPQRADYRAKVEACQSFLRAGSSYELCLTDTTILQCDSDPWSLYNRLRHLNPAPFGAFLRLSDGSYGIDVASSSPERFLSWSRDGTCQFRPIKGTVTKRPGITRAKAEVLLSSPKERAENLMIVDLIRHDVSGVEGCV